MRTMVFDVPAENGGAMTILRQYRRRAVEDIESESIFIIGKASLKETENVKVLRFPWIKKSWFHRLWFDHVVAPHLVRTYRPDHILSLQNVLVPHVSVPQTLYLHQPLPFVEKRYGLRENPRFWIYQHILSRTIYRSVRHAKTVIVQTRWMKQACIDKAGAQPDRIRIEAPTVPIPEGLAYHPTPESIHTFFYPASGLPYKNHRILIEAADILVRKGIVDFRVQLTLAGKENTGIAELQSLVETRGLPVDFLGTIPHEAVLERYTHSILVFPSYIETFGLPLLEARMIGAPVIASDCAFSREILEGYAQGTFFAPDDAEELAVYMGKAIGGYGIM